MKVTVEVTENGIGQVTGHNVDTSQDRVQTLRFIEAISKDIDKLGKTARTYAANGVRE